MPLPRAPTVLATGLVLLALAATASAAPLEPGVAVPEPLPAALPALASPFAGHPLDAPELTGPANIVARAAEIVQSGHAGPRDLLALAAQQQIVGAVEAATPTPWVLDRAGEVLPALPVASLAPPALIGAAVPGPVKGAIVGVSALGLAAPLLPRIPLLPLYSRIQREEAMLNGRRNQLYELVRAEPGIHLSDLVRRSGLGWGAALYHLSVLEQNRVLVVHPEGGFKRYFANGAHSRHDLPRIAALRHEAARVLYDAVQAWPGRSGRELSDALGLSASTLARASERLEDAGLVRRVRDGRRMLYFPHEQPAPTVGSALGPAAA